MSDFDENSGVTRQNRLGLMPREWREDTDGNLRVTAVVLKEGVYPYLEGGEHMEFIPSDEFTAAAIETLEGRPVIVDEHSWRDADNTTRDGLTKGGVAGTPEVRQGGLYCDLLIQDRETARAIKEGELVEVSASYLARLEMTGGEWQGQTYSAVQRNLRFNHILLCPPGAGRLGPEVRIINQKKGIKQMPENSHTIEVKIGNSLKTYRFSNAEDAGLAKEMQEDERASGAAEVDNAMKRMNEINEQKAALEAEAENLRGTLEDFKQKLEEATSMEVIEAAAAELTEQTGVIEDIAQSEADDKAREELSAQISNCKTLPERRAVLVRAVMRKNSIDTADWSQDRIDGAFAALRAQRKLDKEQAAERVPNGGDPKARSNSADNPKTRMMAAYSGK